MPGFMWSRHVNPEVETVFAVPVSEDPVLYCMYGTELLYVTGSRSQGLENVSSGSVRNETTPKAVTSSNLDKPHSKV